MEKTKLTKPTILRLIGKYDNLIKFYQERYLSISENNYKEMLKEVKIKIYQDVLNDLSNLLEQQSKDIIKIFNNINKEVWELTKFGAK